MAADLAALPRTGLEVQLCGDAHLSNFGGFASPERDLDLRRQRLRRDHPRPLRVGRRRLAASLEIAGTRAESSPMASDPTPSVVSARSYRRPCVSSPAMGDLDIWYSRLDAEAIRARWGAQAGPQLTADFEAGGTKARRRTTWRRWPS